jgi:hypothetical protein
MDKIQKVLIEVGRKDLANEYYKKVAGLVDIRGILWSKNWKKFWNLMDEFKETTNKYRSVSSLKDSLGLEDTDPKLKDLLSDVNNILGIISDKLSTEFENLKDVEKRFKVK